MFRVRPYKFPGFGLAGLWHQTSYSGIDINETSKRFDGAVRKAEEPQTRQALHILRQSYDNTADFLLDLYNEEILQQKLEIVVMGLEPLHREFLGCSQANKKGPEHMLLWQGHHAAGGYMETCNAMIHNLLGAAELRLEGARGLDLNHPSAKRDTVLVWLYWSFTMELVSLRAWSQVHLTILPPYHYVMAFVQDQGEKDDAHGMFQRMAETVMALEDFVQKNPSNKLTRSLLTDVSVHHWILTREFIMIGTQRGWHSNEFMEQAVSVFACGNSTKFSLESAFNHLKDSLRQATSGWVHGWILYRTGEKWNTYIIYNHINSCWFPKTVTIMFCTILTQYNEPIEPHWAPLSPNWALLSPNWAHWAPIEPYWAPIEPYWAPIEPHWAPLSPIEPIPT